MTSSSVEVQGLRLAADDLVRTESEFRQYLRGLKDERAALLTPERIKREPIVVAKRLAVIDAELATAETVSTRLRSLVSEAQQAIQTRARYEASPAGRARETSKS